MCAHDHAGRAVAALQAVLHPKALLQDMQRAVGIGHALDRRDLGTLGLNGEHRAALYRLAVEIDRTGAAMGGVAADVRASQIEMFAEVVDEQRARLNEAVDLMAIHAQPHLGLCHGVVPRSGPFNQPLPRSNARLSARSTITPPTEVRYSVEPRVSEAGDMIALAAFEAASSAVFSRPVPRTTAAAAFANKARSDRLESVMAQVAILPRRTVRITPAAAVA